jgi:hypothetical protein
LEWLRTNWRGWAKHCNNQIKEVRRE